jgi:catechol 2,3-dioxygenase-like lactoylglutathione lyase family enzyme
MFSHITVGTLNLNASILFYDALLQPLGLIRREVSPDNGPASACWVHPHATLPRFYVYMPYNQQEATAGNGTMVAFLAPNMAAVDAAYQAGVQQGGTSEGPPGERPYYGIGYYGAYLRDPSGNKIHVVYRGDIT